MTHQYQLTLKIEQISDNIVLSGEFEDEEWETLAFYLQYTEDLQHTKLVQNGMPASLKIRIDRDAGVTVETELPPWEEVIVFLHKFRPLGLKSERTFYFKVAHILSRRIAHPYFRSLIKYSNEIYSGKRLQSGFKLSINEEILNTDKVLYEWLNAYEYHRNKDKRQFIDALHQLFPLEGSKALFLGLLSEKAQAIFHIAGLISVILGKQKSIEVQIPQSDSTGSVQETGA